MLVDYGCVNRLSSVHVYSIVFLYFCRIFCRDKCWWANELDFKAPLNQIWTRIPHICLSKIFAQIDWLIRNVLALPLSLSLSHTLFGVCFHIFLNSHFVFLSSFCGFIFFSLVRSLYACVCLWSGLSSPCQFVDEKWNDNCVICLSDGWLNLLLFNSIHTYTTTQSHAKPSDHTPNQLFRLQYCFSMELSIQTQQFKTQRRKMK